MESRLSGSDISYDPLEMDDDENSPSTYIADESDPLKKLQYEKDGYIEVSKLHDALEKLDARSKDIISQRYLIENKTTLEDLSKKYNISKERVRQIETKSLDILKSNILIA